MLLYQTLFRNLKSLHIIYVITVLKNSVCGTTISAGHVNSTFNSAQLT